MSYRLPNVGQQREAQERVVQLSALSGEALNREAKLRLRCDRGDLLSRVFELRGRYLYASLGKAGKVRRNVPVRDGQGDYRVIPKWAPPDSYWLDPDAAEEVRARCRCRAEIYVVSTADMFDHIRRGKRTMIVPVR
jgi:hypothetical protein